MTTMSNPTLGPEWITSTDLIPYEEALAFMEERVAAIHDGTANECIWLLQHPPLYTAGTSAQDGDLLDPQRFPVYRSGRGGQFTYHGPGQRVAYIMLDLKKRGMDIRRFVYDLEAWLIRSLAALGVHGERRDGRVGIWVVRDDGTEAKIAALGVRVRRWVSFHGIALNVDPDLEHFSGIVPCGLANYGVTSLRDLGKDADMETVDRILQQAWR